MGDRSRRTRPSNEERELIPRNKRMVLRAKRWNNVIHHVSAEKILDHRCVCGALPDLGLDVSGNSLRHPLDPAILDGGYAIFFGRRYNV